MEMDVQLAQNTQNITSLTATVTELSTVVKYEVDRAKEDRNSVKDMVTELKSLNEKISGMAGVQKEMSQTARDIAELRTRVDQLKEWKDKYDLSKMDSRIAALEKIGSEEAGAAKAIATGADWFWRLFGPCITALGFSAIVWYVNHQPSYSLTSTHIEQGGHGQHITGE